VYRTASKGKIKYPDKTKQNKTSRGTRADQNKIKCRTENEK
jgi:hypothetical protein